MSERMTIPANVYDKRKKLYAEKIEEMIKYATTQECRSRQLRAYFGETDTEDCGQCDVCLAKKKEHTSAGSQAVEAIMQLLADGMEHDLSQCQQLPYPFPVIAEALSLLVSEGKVTIDGERVTRS